MCEELKAQKASPECDSHAGFRFRVYSLGSPTLELGYGPNRPTPGWRHSLASGWPEVALSSSLGSCTISKRPKRGKSTPTHSKSLGESNHGSIGHKVILHYSAKSQHCALVSSNRVINASSQLECRSLEALPLTAVCSRPLPGFKHLWAPDNHCNKCNPIQEHLGPP